MDVLGLGLLDRFRSADRCCLSVNHYSFLHKFEAEIKGGTFNLSKFP